MPLSDLKEVELLTERLRKLANTFDPERLKKELAALEQETLEQGFWQDRSRSQQITQKMSRLKQALDQYQKWCSDVSDLGSACPSRARGKR